MKLEPESDLTGLTLAGRFDILALLGIGGMGAVYRARDRELDELVALKVIRSELAEVPEILARFRQEVKLARRVTHVNVARTFELGSGDGVTFCTMELIEGESLTQRLSQRGSLAVAEAVAIASAVCDGLTAAHAAGVIHRDIKPDNVLIAADGRVVMADFGVAALQITGNGDLSGTPAYMAPEQARGEAPTPAADVYAVGVLLAEMLTGRRSFVGGPLKSLADKATVERVEIAVGSAPAELAAVIGHATARDRGARIATAAELQRALAPWAKTGRAATQSSPAARDASELATVVVLAPHGAGAAMHLAEGLQEELLARLDRLPRVRVLPRGEASEVAGAIVIAFTVGDSLTVRLTCEDHSPVELHFALAVDQLAATADAIAAVAAVLVARKPTLAGSAPANEAKDLWLRARHLLRHNQWYDGNAIALLDRAAVLSPNDPEITAARVMGQVRDAFFRVDPDPTALVRAGGLAHAAVIDAPWLADTQLAAGLVALELGDSAAAARHFRAAITCQPHSAAAHENLGKMLLEAGYLDAALVRLDQAIAIAPTLGGARWEIVRAFALEGKWDEYARMVASMMTINGDRPIARARYASWRRDVVELASLRPVIVGKLRLIVPGMVEQSFAVYLDDGWADNRDAMIKIARSLPQPARRTTFVRQLVAESAGYAGDVATCNVMIESAVLAGLYDLHWLDRCPLLEPVHSTPEFARARAIVKRRAEAILDALYGESRVAYSETALE